jgi:hypothetical protein
MKKIFTLVFIILCFYGCKNSVTEPTNIQGEGGGSPRPLYVSGEVLVIFTDSLNYNFIQSFVNGLNVGVLSIGADSAFEMEINIDSGSVNKYIELFSNDSSVVWAIQGSTSYPAAPSNLYLMVRFKGSYSVHYALNLIHSIPGLSWIKTWYSTKDALLKVPIGQEQHWIDSLKTYPFITDATLNYIAYPV